jgi:hypothetical protein
MMKKIISITSVAFITGIHISAQNLPPVSLAIKDQAIKDIQSRYNEYKKIALDIWTLQR